MFGCGFETWGVLCVGMGVDVGGCECGFRFGFALGFLLTGFGFGLGLGIGLGFGCDVVSESRYALLIDLKTEVDCGMHETSWLWSGSEGLAVYSGRLPDPVRGTSSMSRNQQACCTCAHDFLVGTPVSAEVVL